MDEKREGEPEGITAYAVTKHGREMIECYETVTDAFRDMLDLWPEDDSGDVSIEFPCGALAIYMKRDAKDPLVVHAYHVGTDESHVGHVESYKCRYKRDKAGELFTQIERIR